VSGHEIVELSRAESLQLLQYESFVGRVAFAIDGDVHVRPVNYLANEGVLVFCTRQGSVFATVAQGVPIVFEVDASHPSTTVVGA
jgi:uncharacterized protein